MRDRFALPGLRANSLWALLITQKSVQVPSRGFPAQNYFCSSSLCQTMAKHSLLIVLVIDILKSAEGRLNENLRAILRWTPERFSSSIFSETQFRLLQSSIVLPEAATHWSPGFRG